MPNQYLFLNRRRRLCACVIVAILITFPVELLLLRLPWTVRYFGNGQEGWNSLAVVFRALGSTGGEQNEDIFVGGALIISFGVSLLLSFLLINGLILGVFRRK